MKQTERNHYHVLGIPGNAGPELVKKAFREKAKRFHPDRQSGGEAEEEFKIGLELSPNYATGHQWYGEFLFRMRRFEEGRKEIKIAR